mgnify:CR=1 FL=1
MIIDDNGGDHDDAYGDRDDNEEDSIDDAPEIAQLDQHQPGIV